MPGNNLLLVEGTDDEHVVKHLCDHHQLPKIDTIQNLRGISPLLETLPVHIKGSDLKNLGVVVDADTDLAARWQTIQSVLLKAGYASVPPSPAPNGTILDAPSGTLLPRLGIWLMPDNQANGILEDFLRFLVPTNEASLFQHVETSVDSIPQSALRFTNLARPKAIIHTWLAWQKEPGKPLGTAITSRYLDASVPQAAAFAAWLRSLFTTP